MKAQRCSRMRLCQCVARGRCHTLLRWHKVALRSSGTMWRISVMWHCGTLRFSQAPVCKNHSQTLRSCPSTLGISRTLMVQKSTEPDDPGATQHSIQKGLGLFGQFLVSLLPSCRTQTTFARPPKFLLIDAFPIPPSPISNSVSTLLRIYRGQHQLLRYPTCYNPQLLFTEHIISLSFYSSIPTFTYTMNVLTNLPAIHPISLERINFDRNLLFSNPVFLYSNLSNLSFVHDYAYRIVRSAIIEGADTLEGQLALVNNSLRPRLLAIAEPKYFLNLPVCNRPRGQAQIAKIVFQDGAKNGNTTNIIYWYHKVSN